MTEVISEIEDLISEYSGNAGMLQKRLQQYFKDRGISNAKEFLDMTGGEDVFGDPRLTDTVVDLLKNKPIDSGYIQSLDFSENGAEEEDEAFANIQGKIEEELDEKGINFKELLIDPMFISDWPQHKHEMVGRFINPQVPQEEIVERGRIGNLCDPVTVSMIEKLQEHLPTVPAGLDYDQLYAYFEDNPHDYYQAIKDIEELQGPSIEDFLSLAYSTNDLQDVLFKTAVETPFNELPPIMATQVLDGLGEIDSLGILVEDRDFDEFKAKTLKGRIYANELALKEIRAKAIEHQRDVMSEETLSLLRDMSEQGKKVTYRNFSEGLVATGEAEGMEKFLMPQHRDIYNSMKARGMAHPVKIEKGGKIPYTSATVIIIKEKTPEGKFEKLEQMRPHLEPGDFVRLYEFAEQSDSDKNIAINLAQNMQSAGQIDAEKVLGESSARKRDIPTGDVVGGPNERWKDPNPNNRGTTRGSVNGKSR